MTYTMTDCERFTAMAGADFAWRNGPFNRNEPARPPSNVRKALRDDLLRRQGGICPQCGKPAVNAEFCHLVARGPDTRGFVRGNIFAGCSSCNAKTKPEWNTEGNLVRGIAVLTPSDLERPDLVPNEWTPFPILKTR